MVNTKRPVSDINPAVPTELAPKQNDALESDQSSPSTIASARPDLNSPETKSHRVPDMNEAGDHLVATDAGTLGGAAVGATLRMVGGPADAVVGGIVGSVAGNEAADAINPAEEDAYWRELHRDRPYFHETLNTYSDLDYDRDYRGAYEVGYKNRPLFDNDTHFEQVETELRTQWEAIKGQSRLDWEQAKYAAKDAWLRAPC
ncbi:hypothetical protein [Acinetobacter sp. SA01]|uniref:hypothetical protein n=1 Tax=Acinetobacter sp. SA01 TaxID=1862567 RepID=UPI00140C78BA|nr:hypothetical protein [Acinetobacter sp. SA01]